MILLQQQFWRKLKRWRIFWSSRHRERLGKGPSKDNRQHKEFSSWTTRKDGEIISKSYRPAEICRINRSHSNAWCWQSSWGLEKCTDVVLSICINEVGTRLGTSRQFYSRNQFITCNEQFINSADADVPNEEISLGECTQEMNQSLWSNAVQEDAFARWNARRLCSS